MHELKRLGLSTKGLILYYVANIQSTRIHACPVCCSMIAESSKNCIIKIERRAMKIVNPDASRDGTIQTCNLTPVDMLIDNIANIRT